MSELDKITTIEVKRRTSSRLQIMKHSLGFKSLDEMLLLITQASTVQQWTKEQLIEMAIPEESGSAPSERELYEKLNKPKNLTEKGLKIKSKVKKKSAKTENKEEIRIPEMPVSDQFFKGVNDDV
jgi:hypothetical protein